MVRALHRQKIAARGPVRAAFVRELRSQNAPKPRPRRAGIDGPIVFSPGRAAQLTIVPTETADAGGRERGVPLFARWWSRLRGRLHGRLRPAVIAALATGAAVVPASLVIAAAWPQEQLTLSGPGDADTLLYRDMVTPAPRPQGVEARSSVPSLSLRSYRVQADDSLSEIAHTFHIDLDTLISFNGIRDVSELREGVELSIPSASGLAYVVRSGDTLTDIAARHGVLLTELLDWNDLRSSAIDVGQKLFIPGVPLPDHERNAVLGRLFLKPAPGTITTPYGYHPDPVTGIGRFHDGIDIEYEAGTPVIASMAGRVGRLGVNGNYGRYLVLVHADGYQTLYAHLSRAHVSAGSLVAQGQVIATMGSAGYGDYSHLHFSIFKAGEPVDPSRYLH